MEPLYTIKKKEPTSPYQFVILETGPSEIAVLRRHLFDLLCTHAVVDTLVLRPGNEYWLALSSDTPVWIDEVIRRLLQIRLDQKFWQYWIVDGDGFVDFLAEGFEKILPDDGLKQWLTSGWKKAMSYDEAMRWAETL